VKIILKWTVIIMQNNFPQPQRVLVVSAHPDDPDFGAAGTIACWAAQGAEVTYVIVTDGSKGSAEPAMRAEELVRIREAEQRAAAEICGVKNVVFLQHEDGRVVNNTALRENIVRVIRKYRPDVMVTHDPTARIIDNSRLNHTDHRAVGDAALDAVFPLARDRLNFPEHEAEGLEPFKVLDIFLTPSNETNLVVDITDTIELKIKALQAHASQIGDPEKLAERVREWSAGNATGTSFQFAEKFRRVTLRG
jgi:LmbE family N-acetylglucosaminyl deacetylase